jgi:stage III sporulation protein AC
LIRAGREEQGLMVVLAGLIVVMMLVVQEISEMFELIRTTFGF